MFQDRFKTEFNGNFYTVMVEGIRHFDSEDQVMYAEIDTIVILDEEGNYLNESHEDYDDIYDYVQEGLYHVEA